MTGQTHTYCTACNALHPSRVLERDADGFPTRTEFVQPCSAVVVHRLVDASGRLLAIALDVGDWDLIESAVGVLELNDEEGRP